MTKYKRGGLPTDSKMAELVKIDVNHLTESERDQIMAVLKRDDDLRKANEKNISKLKAEIKLIRIKGAVKADQNAEKTCSRCRTELGFFFNSGEMCPKCHSKVCKLCKVVAKDGKWLCTLCFKQMELQYASGEWFYKNLQEKTQNNINLSGTELVRESIRRKPQRNGQAGRNVAEDIKRAITNNNAVKSFHSDDGESSDASIHRVGAPKDSDMRRLTDLIRLRGSSPEEDGGHVEVRKARSRHYDSDSDSSSSGDSRSASPVRSLTDKPKVRPTSEPLVAAAVVANGAHHLGESSSSQDDNVALDQGKLALALTADPNTALQNDFMAAQTEQQSSLSAHPHSKSGTLSLTNDDESLYTVEEISKVTFERVSMKKRKEKQNSLELSDEGAQNEPHLDTVPGDVIFCRPGESITESRASNKGGAPGGRRGVTYDTNIPDSFNTTDDRPVSYNELFDLGTQDLVDEANANVNKPPIHSSIESSVLANPAHSNAHVSNAPDIFEPSYNSRSSSRLTNSDLNLMAPKQSTKRLKSQQQYKTSPPKPSSFQIKNPFDTETENAMLDHSIDYDMPNQQSTSEISQTQIIVVDKSSVRHNQVQYSDSIDGAYIEADGDSQDYVIIDSLESPTLKCSPTVASDEDDEFNSLVVDNLISAGAQKDPESGAFVISVENDINMDNNDNDDIHSDTSADITKDPKLDNWDMISVSKSDKDFSSDSDHSIQEIEEDPTYSDVNVQRPNPIQEESEDANPVESMSNSDDANSHINKSDTELVEVQIEEVDYKYNDTYVVEDRPHSLDKLEPADSTIEDHATDNNTIGIEKQENKDNMIQSMSNLDDTNSDINKPDTELIDTYVVEDRPHSLDKLEPADIATIEDHATDNTTIGIDKTENENKIIQPELAEAINKNPFRVNEYAPLLKSNRVFESENDDIMASTNKDNQVASEQNKNQPQQETIKAKQTEITYGHQKTVIKAHVTAMNENTSPHLIKANVTKITQEPSLTVIKAHITESTDEDNTDLKQKCDNDIELDLNANVAVSGDRFNQVNTRKDAMELDVTRGNVDDTPSIILNGNDTLEEEEDSDDDDFTTTEFKLELLRASLKPLEQHKLSPESDEETTEKKRVNLYDDIQRAIRHHYVDPEHDYDASTSHLEKVKYKTSSPEYKRVECRDDFLDEEPAIDLENPIHFEKMSKEELNNFIINDMFEDNASDILPAIPEENGEDSEDEEHVSQVMEFAYGQQADSWLVTNVPTAEDKSSPTKPPRMSTSKKASPISGILKLITGKDKNKPEKDDKSDQPDRKALTLDISKSSQNNTLSPIIESPVVKDTIHDHDEPKESKSVADRLLSLFTPETSMPPDLSPIIESPSMIGPNQDDSEIDLYPKFVPPPKSEPQPNATIIEIGNGDSVCVSPGTVFIPTFAQEFDGSDSSLTSAQHVIPAIDESNILLNEPKVSSDEKEDDDEIDVIQNKIESLPNIISLEYEGPIRIGGGVIEEPTTISDVHAENSNDYQDDDNEDVIETTPRVNMDPEQRIPEFEDNSLSLDFSDDASSLYSIHLEEITNLSTALAADMINETDINPTSQLRIDDPNNPMWHNSVKYDNVQEQLPGEYKKDLIASGTSTVTCIDAPIDIEEETRNVEHGIVKHEVVKTEESTIIETDISQVAIVTETEDQTIEEMNASGETYVNNDITTEQETILHEGTTLIDCRPYENVSESESESDLSDIMEYNISLQSTQSVDTSDIIATDKTTVVTSQVIKRDVVNDTTVISSTEKMITPITVEPIPVKSIESENDISVQPTTVSPTSHFEVIEDNEAPNGEQTLATHMDVAEDIETSLSFIKTEYEVPAFEPIETDTESLDDELNAMVARNSFTGDDDNILPTSIDEIMKQEFENKDNTENIPPQVPVESIVQLQHMDVASEFKLSTQAKTGKPEESTQAQHENIAPEIKIEPLKELNMKEDETSKDNVSEEVDLRVHEISQDIIIKAQQEAVFEYMKKHEVLFHDEPTDNIMRINGNDDIHDGKSTPNVLSDIPTDGIDTNAPEIKLSTQTYCEDNIPEIKTDPLVEFLIRAQNEVVVPEIKTNPPEEFVVQPLHEDIAPEIKTDPPVEFVIQAQKEYIISEIKSDTQEESINQAQHKYIDLDIKIEQPVDLSLKEDETPKNIIPKETDLRVNEISQDIMIKAQQEAVFEYMKKHEALFQDEPTDTIMTMNANDELYDGKSTPSVLSNIPTDGIDTNAQEIKLSTQIYCEDSAPKIKTDLPEEIVIQSISKDIVQEIKTDLPEEIVIQSNKDIVPEIKTDLPEEFVNQVQKEDMVSEIKTDTHVESIVELSLKEDEIPKNIISEEADLRVNEISNDVMIKAQHEAVFEDMKNHKVEPADNITRIGMNVDSYDSESATTSNALSDISTGIIDKNIGEPEEYVPNTPVQKSISNASTVSVSSTLVKTSSSASSNNSEDVKKKKKSKFNIFSTKDSETRPTSTSLVKSPSSASSNMEDDLDSSETDKKKSRFGFLRLPKRKKKDKSKQENKNKSSASSMDLSPSYVEYGDDSREAAIDVSFKDEDSRNDELVTPVEKTSTPTTIIPEPEIVIQAVEGGEKKLDDSSETISNTLTAHEVAVKSILHNKDESSPRLDRKSKFKHAVLPMEESPPKQSDLQWYAYSINLNPEDKPEDISPLGHGSPIGIRKDSFEEAKLKDIGDLEGMSEIRKPLNDVGSDSSNNSELERIELEKDQESFVEEINKALYNPIINQLGEPNMPNVKAEPVQLTNGTEDVDIPYITSNDVEILESTPASTVLVNTSNRDVSSPKSPLMSSPRRHSIESNSSENSCTPTRPRRAPRRKHKSRVPSVDRERKISIEDIRKDVDYLEKKENFEEINAEIQVPSRKPSDEISMTISQDNKESRDDIPEVTEESDQSGEEPREQNTKSNALDFEPKVESDIPHQNQDRSRHVEHVNVRKQSPVVVEFLEDDEEDDILVGQNYEGAYPGDTGVYRASSFENLYHGRSVSQRTFMKDQLDFYDSDEFTLDDKHSVSHEDNKQEIKDEAQDDLNGVLSKSDAICLSNASPQEESVAHMSTLDKDGINTAGATLPNLQNKPDLDLSPYIEYDPPLNLNLDTPNKQSIVPFISEIQSSDNSVPSDNIPTNTLESNKLPVSNREDPKHAVDVSTSDVGTIPSDKDSALCRDIDVDHQLQSQLESSVSSNVDSVNALGRDYSMSNNSVISATGDSSSLAHSTKTNTPPLRVPTHNNAVAKSDNELNVQVEKVHVENHFYDSETSETTASEEFEVLSMAEEDQNNINYDGEHIFGHSGNLYQAVRVDDEYDLDIDQGIGDDEDDMELESKKKNIPDIVIEPPTPYHKRNTKSNDSKSPVDEVVNPDNISKKNGHDIITESSSNLEFETTEITTSDRETLAKHLDELNADDVDDGIENQHGSYDDINLDTLLSVDGYEDLSDDISELGDDIDDDDISMLEESNTDVDVSFIKSKVLNDVPMSNGHIAKIENDIDDNVDQSPSSTTNEDKAHTNDNSNADVSDVENEVKSTNRNFENENELELKPLPPKRKRSKGKQVMVDGPSLEKDVPVAPLRRRNNTSTKSEEQGQENPSDANHDTPHVNGVKSKADEAVPSIKVTEHTTEDEVDLTEKEFEELADDFPEDENIDELFMSHKSVGNLQSSNLTSSQESIMSIYSEAGEGYYGIPVEGDIQFAIDFNYKTDVLTVNIRQCKHLAAVDPKRNRSDPYVKVYLLPDRTKGGKRKTRVKKHTLSPTFNESLKYHITKSELETRILLVSVWHNDSFGRNAFLGEVSIPLEDRSFDYNVPEWYKLQERDKSQAQLLSYKGDFFIDLKYITGDKVEAKESPTKKKSKKPAPPVHSRGELHVIVKSAINLTAIKSAGYSDPFCKGYLLPDKSKKAKMKTPVVKKNCNPVWNHTFVFEDVPLADLKERSLELTIWDYDRLSSNDFLGGVRLNLGTGESNGKEVEWMDARGDEVSLWQRMLSSKNQVITGSLPLRPNMDYIKMKPS
ncbi:unnamed protein product [Owenia fusiformis]|uniref:Uncharacterized protein n=1 Tax=Owenia fusiformis TaxID=6347 RepID=A0A8S4Q2R5_OWEFU|nr:unnamed protein product [Owenia fusiformis]